MNNPTRKQVAAQPNRFPDDQACLGYSVNHLSGPALNMIRSYVAVNTGRIRFDSSSDLLELLRQAYDDPDRTRTANHVIHKQRQKNGTFSAYLAEFGRIMGDLSWNEEAQREQLYEGLSDKLKDALVTSRPRWDSMGHLIQIWGELDNRIRAHATERAATPRTQ